MQTKEKIYDWITDDGEPRICEAISEEQCDEVPGSFLKNALSGWCSKLAEQVVSAGVTLPWIFDLIGASTGLTGLLVPIKNAGSLLPQLVVSAKIRAFPKRKYFWAGAAFAQSFFLFLMFLAVYFLDGNTAGFLIILSFFLFSVASGVGSVSFKDVLAKTIPKGKRGRLLATRATGGGILTLLAGFVMYFFISDSGQDQTLYLLILTAVLLWALSAFLFSFIAEKKGATQGGRSPIKELKKGWELFTSNRDLRNFIFARAMLMAIPLAQPFLIIYGKQTTNAALSGLGLLVIASGIAGFISSPFWGKFADQSSRKLMIAVAVLGIINLSSVLLFELLPPAYLSIYTFAPLILINMMIHSGARLSRKTWLTDFAPENERPLYISLSNTCIGLFTILTAGIGFIAELFSLSILLYFLMGMLAISAFFSYSLQEA